MKRFLLFVIIAVYTVSFANAQTSGSKRKRSTESTSGSSNTSEKGGKGKHTSSVPKSIVVSTCGITFELQLVSKGYFMMGANSEMKTSWYDEDETPAHSVVISKNVYMGKTEVTQAQWKAVMGNNPSKFVGDDRPVEHVSWLDCQEFISRLNYLTGRKFRLPTEAEWEYAARGGNKRKATPYSGSKDLGSVAWYVANSENETHPVASKTPNELGLYDMSGNVGEWCSDYYGQYSSEKQTDPQGVSAGTCRVYRGGSWLTVADYTRCSCRSYYPDNKGENFIGLRLVLEEK